MGVDAHWADVPSLRFLTSLAHRLEGLAVAVVVRRLGESGAAETWLERLAGVARSLRGLRPLSAAAVGKLVRAAYDAEADEQFGQACTRAVGGNPLYLRELLGALREREIPATAPAAHYVDKRSAQRTFCWKRAPSPGRRGARAAAIVRSLSADADALTDCPNEKDPQMQAFSKSG